MAKTRKMIKLEFFEGAEYQRLQRFMNVLRSIKDFGGSMADQKKDSTVSGVYEGLVASKVWQEMANRYLSARQEITNVG